MRFLILGASGMVGHTIALYLMEKGCKVVGISRRKVNYVNSIELDVTDLKALSNFVLNSDFDVIVNAVGILNEDAEKDKASAVFINSYLPHFLEEITAERRERIFQLSTDCVFSGRTGGYTEDSLPDGSTFYDRTKALGEIINRKDLTIRCSIIGPDINSNGIGLFNWFMRQSGSVNGYSKVMWTGLTTVELARTIVYAAENNLSGLIHFVPDDSISKYDLLRLFSKYFRNNRVRVRNDESVMVNKTLLRDKVKNPFVNKTYELQIVDMKNWIIGHPYLYGHYL